MTKKKILLIIFITIAFGIIIINLYGADSFAGYRSKINSKIYNEFEKSEKVRVIVNLKQIYNGPGQNSIKSSSDKKILQNISKISDRGKYFSALVSKDELKIMENSDAVEFIEKEREIRALLQNTTRIVNATASWNLQVSGLNLTGLGKTVCILDSGVNSSHSDLTGRVIAEYCYCSLKEGSNTYCCPGNLNEGNDASDNNGHGTHVSGIVAASGGINGVAKGANIIMIKILNSSGSGTTSDLISGLDWCINNASKYNITAISLSLGDGVQYTDYCDDGDLTNQKINSAFGKNISVVVATGNDYWNDGIEWPACLQNATPVSSTDKTDAIASYADRNWMVKLFAPGGISTNSGTKINSTWKTGGYNGNQGTSMATPHVSGAIAIISEYLNLTNRTRTPSQIEDILYTTGKNFTENGNNYSRIDIYNALLSLDVYSPVVNLISPSNNSRSSIANQSFSCNASDLQLHNVTFFIWNSSNSLINNQTLNLTGAANSSSFNVTGLSYDDYQWNCLVFDASNNSAFAASNYSFSLNYITIELNSPSNNLFTNQNQSYNCSAITGNSLNLNNITFYVWNSSRELVYNLTTNISGVSNSSNFNYNFSSQGNYTWNCLGYNNNSQNSFATANFSISYELISPNISSVLSTATTTSSTVSWTTNENSNATFSYGTNSSNLNNSILNSSYSTNHSVLLSDLASSTVYYYNITSCDPAGNCIIDGSYSFTTATPEAPPSGGGSSGGGGGGGSANTNKTYNINSEEIIRGYTKDLAKNDQIKFSLAGEAKLHSLVIDEISKNYARITIKSNPIIINLNIGESVKLNLTSPNFYNLDVRLESISNNKANITIKNIHEEIPLKNPEPSPEEREIRMLDDKIYQENPIDRVKNYNILTAAAIGISILIILILAITLNKKIHIKKKKSTIKEYKEKFQYLKGK